MARFNILNSPIILFCFFLTSCTNDEETVTHLYPSASYPQAQIVDQAIKLKMDKVGASAVTFAVFDQGKLAYAQAYGYQDQNKTHKLPVDALMRTASNVKPITAAAIQILAQAGALNLSDHAFCTGENKPCWLPASLSSDTTDIRVKDITVRQLIDHQGGFSRDSDPFGSEYLCAALNLHCPPNRETIVEYMLTQPLDFTPGDPGMVDGYSNFGYMVLGMIIERASGMSYIDYVRKAVMNPIGVKNINFTTAHTLLTDRSSREPNYISTLQSPSVYTIGKEAAFADEGFIAENWLAVGTCLSTAQALAQFASQYSLPFGERLQGPVQKEGAHWGGMDGISSIVRQLPSGKSYAIFLNISIDFPDFSDLQMQLDSIVQ